MQEVITSSHFVDKKYILGVDSRYIHCLQFTHAAVAAMVREEGGEMVFKRHGYTFAWTGPQSQADSVRARMLAQGWTLVHDTWGAAVLAVGAL